MKKKVIIGLIVLALVIVAIAIPKSTYQRWFGKKDKNNNILPLFHTLYYI